jgi:hypothetical protein
MYRRKQNIVLGAIMSKFEYAKLADAVAAEIARSRIGARCASWIERRGFRLYGHTDGIGQGFWPLIAVIAA